MRVAVLSDIHSNLVALDAVLGSLGSIDAIWQLGDIVGYGPDPDGVVERLIGVGAEGVRGNHDAAAVGGREIEWFNPDARAAMEWTRREISEATRAWLAALPERHANERHLLVHGSPRDPTWEYITNVSVARANLAEVAERGAVYGFHGHTHVPVVFRDDDGRIEAITPAEGSAYRLDDRPALINPGSVGQPRDGRPSSSWLELDTDAGTCTWRRVEYDIPAVQAAMRSVGLPERLAGRLAFGF